MKIFFAFYFFDTVLSFKSILNRLSTSSSDITPNLLKSQKNESYDELMRIASKSIRFHKDTDPTSENLWLIRDLCMQGNYEGVMSLLQPLRNDEEIKICYSLAIIKFTNARQWNFVEDVINNVCGDVNFEEMQNSKRSFTITQALYICNKAMGSASKIREYQKVIKWFSLANFFLKGKLSQFSYSCAIRAAHKLGDDERVLILTRKVRNDKSLEMDSAMYKYSLISALTLKR